MCEQWLSRICRSCGEEISLLEKDIRRNCDTEGNFVVKCPICFKGRLHFSLAIPLTQREILAKVI